MIPRTVVMVRPKSFHFNNETSGSNVFQKNDQEDHTSVLAKALSEFDDMAGRLARHGIGVRIFEDTDEPEKPDAVFPNNWISFHPDGRVILYPMMAANRRQERRTDIIEILAREFLIKEVIDLTREEEKGLYLEGTGSVVFDHGNRILYACHSPRTSQKMVEALAVMLGYRFHIFHALDENSVPVYHTNVMMAVGRKFVVICLDSISEEEQEALLETFAGSGLKVIAISFAQMRSFAGNLFEVENEKGESLIIISSRAMETLLPGQKQALSKFGQLLSMDIPTIENYGGGSVRCMVAGVYLPKRISV